MCHFAHIVDYYMYKARMTGCHSLQNHYIGRAFLYFNFE